MMTLSAADRAGRGGGPAGGGGGGCHFSPRPHRRRTAPTRAPRPPRARRLPAGGGPPQGESGEQIEGDPGRGGHQGTRPRAWQLEGPPSRGLVCHSAAGAAGAGAGHAAGGPLRIGGGGGADGGILPRGPPGRAPHSH
eukprot:3077387-Pyramimonas_sp.AAC.1